MAPILEVVGQHLQQSDTRKLGATSGELGTKGGGTVCSFRLAEDEGSVSFPRRSSGQALIRRSKCPWLSTQAEVLECTLTGTRRGQAWQTRWSYLLRCCAFWRCGEAWAALRFSDRIGLDPSACGLNESSFRSQLTRTKTTGKDKKFQSRVLHVSRNCWLVHPTWLEVGWNLWQKAAPWDRDYFQPVPTRALDHWENSSARTRTPQSFRRHLNQMWSLMENSLVQTCCWPIVERAQPESIPAELHRLSPFRENLARCHWRLVTGTLARIREDNQATHRENAK